MTAIFGALYAWWIYSVPRGVGREILSTEMLLNLRASWLLIPAAIGAAAIAEERSMGVTAWQQTLPAKHQTLFKIKLGVALVLSFLLGSLAPLPLDYWLQSVTVPLAVNSPEAVPSSIAIGLTTWVCPVLITLLAFYASSLSASLLQALLITTLLSIGLMFHFAAADRAVQSFSLVNPTLFIALVTTIVLVPTLIFRAYRNDVSFHTTRSKIAHTITTWVIASTLIIALCVAVFSRFWDSWLPLPSIVERPASASTKPQFLPGSWSEIQILTAEGQLLALLLPSHPLLGDEDRSHLIAIAPGETWHSVAQSGRNRLAIKADGSLWHSSPSLRQLEHPQLAQKFPNTKIDSELPWLSILSTRRFYDGNKIAEFFALKTDGSLHRATETPSGNLGTFSPIPLAQPLKELHATDDYLLGLTQSGKLALLGHDPKHLVHPTLPSVPTPPSRPDELNLGLTVLDDVVGWDSIHIIPNAIWLPQEGFSNQLLTEAPSRRSRRGFEIPVFKKTDGSHWTFAWIAQFAYGQEIDSSLPYQLVKVEQDPWRRYLREWSYNYAIDRRTILQTDGTLWHSLHKSNFGNDRYFNFMDGQHLTRLGNRSDWEVIRQHHDGTYFGITSNDILWTWGAPPRRTNQGRKKVNRLIPYRDHPRPIFDLRLGQAIGK